MENKVRKKKSPALVLRVTVNGQQVQKKNSTETFLECIKIIGIEKIAGMPDIRIGGLPLIVVSRDHRLQMKQLNKKWYVCTHMSTREKKFLLEKIGKKLGVNLKIEIL